MKQCILEAQEIGEIDSKADVDQAVFEVEAMFLAGDFLFVMTNNLIHLAQARQGMENVLARLSVSTKLRKE